jgi:hypothetical protein
MAGGDGFTSRIVVSLWTVHVVTVLFVVASMSIWFALGTTTTFDHAGLRITGISFLALVLMLFLLAEFRFYVRNILSTKIYMRLQISKAVLWTMMLCVLLGAASGVEDAGIQIFREAAKKLL